MRCTRALFVVTLCMAAAMASATPKLVDSFWGKIESKKSSPAFGLFAQQSSNPVNARQAGTEEKEQPKPAPTKPVVKKEVQPPKEEEVAEDAGPEVEEEPKPIVREIPIFARTILGDLANPRLASMDELRDFDLRTHETFLEPATDMTLPLVEELYKKSQEVLRVFNELQLESNAFVEDAQKHNDKGNKKFIGYYY